MEINQINIGLASLIFLAGVGVFHYILFSRRRDEHHFNEFLR
tara:strand:- start:1272 stop:1397 length:126 start_codon:yes stop_codon:yes gene_type:complete